MPLHPVLAELLATALEPAASAPCTPRDARLPAVPGKVHSVIGMRRAGKTTFLRQLLEARRTAVPPERAVYLSFDDDRLNGLGLEQLGYLLEEYYRINPGLRGRAPAYWFLDEIQIVPEWERFARRVLDTERIELVVSGSSSKLLSREVHTSLRGRGMATTIRPFSFREYLRHRGEEPARSPDRWKPADRSLVERRFREFLIEGGLPEVQGLAPALRIELLQGYVDTLLFRDIVERHGISQVSAARWLVRHCLRNPAGSVSVHRLHQDLQSQGLGVARDLVNAMLDHLADAFLVTVVRLATDSERQRNSNPRKVYPSDPGFIRAFDASGRPNTGHALETVVLHELERRGAEVGYVKTGDGLEVDFLAHYPAAGEELIQVCADVTATATLAREVSALEQAGATHRRAVRTLLVPNRDSAARVSVPGVHARSAPEWMLEDTGRDAGR